MTTPGNLELSRINHSFHEVSCTWEPERVNMSTKMGTLHVVKLNSEHVYWSFACFKMYEVNYGNTIVFDGTEYWSNDSFWTPSSLPTRPTERSVRFSVFSPVSSAVEIQIQGEKNLIR